MLDEARFEVRRQILIGERGSRKSQSSKAYKKWLKQTNKKLYSQKCKDFMIEQNRNQKRYERKQKSQEAFTKWNANRKSVDFRQSDFFYNLKKNSDASQ